MSFRIIQVDLSDDQFTDLKIDALKTRMTLRAYVKHLILRRASVDFRMAKMREALHDKGGK